MPSRTHSAATEPRSVDAQEARCFPELPVRPLERLPHDGPVHLVHQHLVEVGDLLILELVEEGAQAQIKELLQRQLQRIHRHSRTPPWGVGLLSAVRWWVNVGPEPRVC